MKRDLTVAIFDLDGLILDSEAFYAKVWSEAFNSNSLKEYKVEESVMIEWFYKNISGKKIGQQLDNIQNNINIMIFLKFIRNIVDFLKNV